MAILGVFLAGLYQTWLTQGDALLLGVAVAVLGPLGDLFESLIKRDAGIKDAGSLFGPHGGALDRADAALFTLVAGLLRLGRRDALTRCARWCYACPRPRSKMCWIGCCRSCPAASENVRRACTTWNFGCEATRCRRWRC